MLVCWRLPSCICELECEHSSAVHLRCVKCQSEDQHFSATAAVVYFIINCSEQFVWSAVGEQVFRELLYMSVCLSLSPLFVMKWQWICDQL